MSSDKRHTKCGIHIDGILFSLEKEILSHATMQVNLQGIMQNETSQWQIETDSWLPQPEKWKKWKVVLMDIVSVLHDKILDIYCTNNMKTHYWTLCSQMLGWFLKSNQSTDFPIAIMNLLIGFLEIGLKY